MSVEEADRRLDAAERGGVPDVAPEEWPRIVDALVAAGRAEAEAARVGDLLDSAVEHAPDAPELYVARGALYRAAGRLAAAADELEYACEMSPADEPEPWLRLASVEAERGLWEDAANALDQALDHGADDPELFARLGEAHWEARNATRAIAAFEEGLEERPNDPHLRLGRARASLDLELYEDAIEDCIAAAAGHPRPAAVYRVHARALQGQRQDARAIEMLDKAVDADRSDAESLRLRGDLHSSMGDIARAAQDYRAAQAIEADDETELALADCLIELGDPAAALELGRRLLERVTAPDGRPAARPADAQPQGEAADTGAEAPFVDEFDVRLVLSRALHSLGREPEALAMLHEALEIDPEAADPYLDRARIHAAAGRKNLAWRDARWALDRDPDSIEAFLMRGRMALDIESPAEALGDFEAALELDPEHGPAHAWRGRAFALMGDMRAAAAEWELAERHLPARHALRETLEAWRKAS